MPRAPDRDPLGPVPRVALSREHAASALDMSLNTFEKYVQADLRLLRIGAKVLVPVAELERWAHENARRTV